jgi:pyridoxine 5-phosphate synthase
MMVRLNDGRREGDGKDAKVGDSFMTYLRLGVNIDHVATIRNARGGGHPDPVRAARAAAAAGADLPLNFEMAATEEMLEIALRHKPHAVCIVPEKREEVTTEGGLDAFGQHNRLTRYCEELAEAGCRVSLFIEADKRQLEAAVSIGAPVVEIHAGAYCEAGKADRPRELARIVESAQLCESLGLECHVGHGLSFDTVGPVAAIQTVAELNIGHFLIGEAIFGGLESSIKRMRALMDNARAEVSGQVSA